MTLVYLTDLGSLALCYDGFDVSNICGVGAYIAFSCFKGGDGG